MYFGDMLSAMLYILVPWSAINLTDYHWVRCGRYSIADLFRLNGIYGRLRWPVIAVYLVRVALQIPFLQLSFYSRRMARLIGADIAWVPGLIVPTVLYYVVERPGIERPGVLKDS